MSLAVGSRRAERRQLTILFADLNDSTELATDVEAEDYADLLDKLQRCFEYVVPRHGGTIVQIRGDGILAMFGLESREDEARRAIEAALELHKAAKEISYAVKPEHTLTMHSGIHSGLVLVIEGDPVFGRYILAGDPPNIAARLSDEAGRDEIIVSELSLGADRQFFATGRDRALTLKGKEQPVRVFSVLGRSDVNTRFEARRRRGNTPLVGRVQELIRMRVALDQCGNNQPQSIAIVAAPGMGKTRLVEEFLAGLSVTKNVVLRGYCESYLSAEPLQPILQILRKLFGADAQEKQQTPFDPARQQLRNHPAPSHVLEIFKAFLTAANAAQKPPEHELVGAILLYLEQVTALQPVVVFIDDWQWADDATRRVFNALTTLTNAKLLFVTTSRGPLPANPPGEFSVIKLEPLQLEQSARIIHSLIPDGDRFMASRIEQVSGGNALFLEELCHAARLTGTTTAADFRGHEQQQIPNNLKMLIGSRIAGLSVEQQSVVRIAAVIGNVVHEWLLQEIASIAKDDPLLETLAEQDLIFPGEVAGTLRFKHAITRDLVVDSIGLHERRALHVKIAETLEARHRDGAREALVETLAYHYCDTAEYAKAAKYAEAAGDKALAGATLDRARLQYQAALRALDQLDQTQTNYKRWMSIARKLAMPCMYDARRDQLKIYQRAVQLATARDDLAGLTEAEYRLALINYALGDGRAAIRHCLRARATVSRIDNLPFKIQINATLGQTHAIACEFELALPELNEALAQQRPHKHDPRVASAFAYSLATKGLVLGDQGHFEDAFACFDEAEEAVQSLDHEIHLSLAGMHCGVLLWQGRWTAGLQFATRTVELADRMGSHYMSALGVAMRGYANWKLELDPAAEQLERGMEWLAPQEQALNSAMVLGWLAEVMVELDRPAAARGYAARALLRGRKGDRLGESNANCALASMPAEHSRRAPEYYFKRAYACAAARESRRERAIIQLKEAEYLSRASNSAAVLDRVKQSRSEFTAMGMFWYADRTQALEGRLRTLSLA